MEKTHTTFDVAKICGVYPTTVVDWIDNGKLKAFTTPGGHRRIKENDFLAFLRKYNIPFNGELKKQHSVRVLIVDDDSGIVRMLSKLIKKTFPGMEVDVAADGFDAGIKLGEFRPDIILLDVMLPGINGFGVCRQVKSNEKTKDIRIIAMSGFDTPGNKEKILKCGADDYISKPFDTGVMADKIKALMEKVYA